LADVAWLTDSQLAVAEEMSILLTAPAICVEVISPRNREAEMLEKMALYFDAGASEVWLCEESGAMRFFVAEDQPGNASVLMPGFPSMV
jgi:Uma2 family endonuclease